jgi:hypothetical protein
MRVSERSDDQSGQSRTTKTFAKATFERRPDLDTMETSRDAHIYSPNERGWRPWQVIPAFARAERPHLRRDRVHNSGEHSYCHIHKYHATKTPTLSCTLRGGQLEWAKEHEVYH